MCDYDLWKPFRSRRLFATLADCPPRKKKGRGQMPLYLPPQVDAAAEENAVV